MSKEKKNKIKKKDFDAFQRIDWIPREEGFRTLLARAMKIRGIPDEAVGWCSVFWKDEIPDIEMYVDEIIKWTALELKLQNRLTDDNMLLYLRYALTLTLTHELVHLFGGIRDERVVEELTDELIKDAWMGWHYIPCPKDEGKLVTWSQCLQCDDDVKHPSCPFRNIRIDAQPRKLIKYQYHVTELLIPLMAYWERAGAKYSRSWEEYYDMLFGKALGWYIESKYPEHCREIDLEWKHPDGYSVTGHADVYLDDTGRLVELKFYYSNYYVAKEGKGKPDHVFQAQAYYTLGMKCKPWLFRNIKRISIVYYSKTKSNKMPRRIEIDVPLKTVDIETPAKVLFEAERDGKPPINHQCSECKEWRSRYCRYFMCPKHPKFNGE